MKRQHGIVSYFAPAVKGAVTGSFSEHGEGGQSDDEEGADFSSNKTGDEDSLGVNESDPSSSSQLPEQIMKYYS